MQRPGSEKELVNMQLTHPFITKAVSKHFPRFLNLFCA